MSLENKPLRVEVTNQPTMRVSGGGVWIALAIFTIMCFSYGDKPSLHTLICRALQKYIESKP